MDQGIAKRTEELAARLSQAPGFDSVTCFSEDARLVLEGSVESYALKHELEQIAGEAGFSEIDNCVRVLHRDPATQPGHSEDTSAGHGRPA